jgi:hypothetical protein
VWDPAADVMVVGESIERAVYATETLALPASISLYVRRLDTTLYALTVDVRVGSTVTLARRRARMLVQRATTADSSKVVAPPLPIARWSTVDLY